MKISDFELKVLRYISDGTNISGHGMVAYVAAARRLEKKGLAVKNIWWHITEAGRKILAERTGVSLL